MKEGRMRKHRTLFRKNFNNPKTGLGKECPRSWHISIGVIRKWFHWKREYCGWILCLLGCRLHVHWSYGGQFG